VFLAIADSQIPELGPEQENKPTLDFFYYPNALNTADSQNNDFLRNILFLNLTKFGTFIPN